MLNYLLNPPDCFSLASLASPRIAEGETASVRMPRISLQVGLIDKVIARKHDKLILMARPGCKIKASTGNNRSDGILMDLFLKREIV